jgi:hypothetical protein
VIIRLTSDQLRKLADQVDAHTALKQAGADHPAPNTTLSVDGEKLAYLHWWQSGDSHMAEFTSFVPGDAEPLAFHEVNP